MLTLIAGWMAGYAMSIVTTVSLTIIIARSRESSWFEKVIAREVSGALLAVPVFMGTAMIWTLIGLYLGALFMFAGFEDDPPMLGAYGGSWLFIALGIGAIPLPPLLLLIPRYWRLWLANSVSFIGLFGWVMPFLATR